MPKQSSTLSVRQRNSLKHLKKNELRKLAQIVGASDLKTNDTEDEILIKMSGTKFVMLVTGLALSGIALVEVAREIIKRYEIHQEEQNRERLAEEQFKQLDEFKVFIKPNHKEKFSPIFINTSGRTYPVINDDYGHSYYDTSPSTSSTDGHQSIQ